MGSWAGLGGGARRPSGWLDIARWSRRIDLHHRVRLVWGIAPMDGGRGRRGEGWRGGQARSCPSRWGWCWRGGAAPSGLLGRASASEPRRSLWGGSARPDVVANGDVVIGIAVPLRLPPPWPLLLWADGHTPGLGDCPPPPARPSRALACKQGVLGLGGRVGVEGGWWGGGSNPTPGPPLGFCSGAGHERRRRCSAAG